MLPVPGQRLLPLRATGCSPTSSCNQSVCTAHAWSSPGGQAPGPGPAALPQAPNHPVAAIDGAECACASRRLRRLRLPGTSLNCLCPKPTAPQAQFYRNGYRQEPKCACNSASGNQECKLTGQPTEKQKAPRTGQGLERTYFQRQIRTSRGHRS